MISPTDGGARIEGVPAVAWLRRHRRELVGLAVRALAEHPLSGVPDPTRQSDVELSWIVGYNLDLFIEVLQHGRTDLDERGAPDLVASAARRALEGSTLESLLHDYQVAMEAIWRTVADRVRPDELRVAIELATVAHEHMRCVTTLILRGFEHVASRISIGQQDARFTVYSALLSGEQPQVAAERAGIQFAPYYAVLMLHLSGADEAGDLRSVAQTPPGRASQVVQHRRINALQALLEDHADGDVLAVIVETSGTALVPLGVETIDAARSRCRDLASALCVSLGDDVLAAAEVAAPDAIPAAAEVAAQVLLVARATGATEGTWFLEDVLVPYQLTRPGPGRDLLERRLQVVDGHPEWEATVRAFVAHRFDRRATAEALHLHPNSVDYRLSRFAKACGIDAADPSQRALVIASLVVRDLARLRPRSSDL